MTSELNTDYCRAKVAPEGSTLYYCLLVEAPPRRALFAAWFALERELAEIAEECNDTTVARHKLQWWARELEALGEGRASHPVTRALHRHDAIGRHEPVLAELIVAAEERIAIAQIQTETELRGLCLRSAGTITRAIAGSISRKAAGVALARDAGAACERVRLLGYPARAGMPAHSSCPLRDLLAFDVSPGDFDRRHAASPEPETARALEDLLRSQASGTLEWLRSIEQANRETPPDQRLPGALCARVRIGAAQCRRLAAKPLRRDPEPLPITKLWYAWRSR